MYYHNCYGLWANMPLLLSLLVSKKYSIIALAETWLVDIPNELRKVCSLTGYNLHYLPAIPTTRGRAARGLLLLVRRTLTVSSVVSHRDEFGEFLSCFINNSY